tara:strand:- start:1283 stop:2479 length:1197 start_codon:yes stop_codon:yes gene_type:complete
MAAIVKPNQKAIDALPRAQSGQTTPELRIEGHRYVRLWKGINGDSYGYRLTIKGERTCAVVCTEVGVKEALRLVETEIRSKRQGKHVPKGQLIVREIDVQIVVPEIEATLGDVKGAKSRLNVLHRLQLQPGISFGNTDYSQHTKATAKGVLYKAKEGRSAATANRIFHRYSKNCSILVDAGLLDSSPCVGVKTLPERNVREVVPTDDQLRLHCKIALEKRTPQALAQVLSACIGTRIGETVALEWNMIAPDGGSFILPNTKNGRSARFCLNSPSQVVIDLCREFAINKWVFPSFRKDGAHIKPPRESFETIRDTVMDRLYSNSKIARPEPYRQHDFRRAFGSRFSSVTGDLRLTQLALNHKSSSTTERYTHYLPTEMADASERTAQALFGDLFTTTNL